MSPQQLAANRANSLLSTGPASQAGKRRSSLNAYRHGLTGKIHIATTEETAAFQKHCDSFRQALAPVGILEEELAQEIAEDRWRLKRARSLENSIFAEGHNRHVGELESGHPEVNAAIAEGKIWIEQAKYFQLLTLYETRIRRAIEKNTCELKAMQSQRKEAYANAQREALLLQRVAESEGKVYDPASDFMPAQDHGGFVFSSSEIARFLDRKSRLARAEAASGAGLVPAHAPQDALLGLSHK
jgi:hypothetical protein